jgi:hypothetical protein
MSWSYFTVCEGYERQGSLEYAEAVKELEQQGFPEYAEAVKERLVRHGFTRPFRLDEDAAQQDKLMT